MNGQRGFTIMVTNDFSGDWWALAVTVVNKTYLSGLIGPFQKRRPDNYLLI